ncbi:MAG: hypothetical protein FRX49_03094 [Trebouxia sp. A1-2]|nr:MAG: hypothetical protein FRX49_03094 [Trebouxia sp. A1-2]
MDLTVLDELVEEYMLQEELTDKSSSAPASSSLPVRRACESVRVLLEAGDVRSAQEAIPLQCQEALKDQRLIFRLKKQEVVEYLRQGTPEAQQQALECIRHDYASLAENAYPEAYSEFKHSMLLLVFEEELQTSPVKADWSLQTRTELAGMLCRTLRVYPATLSLLLRHLLLTHQTCHMHGCLPAGACDAVKKLPEQLLPSTKPKDPGPLPCEDQAAAAKPLWPLAVEDAQALVTALDIPWEAASHLLKHTRGNLFAAFKNELSAYHVNDKLVDELVWEYAAHRGLLSLTDSEEYACIQAGDEASECNQLEGSTGSEHRKAAAADYTAGTEQRKQTAADNRGLHSKAHAHVAATNAARGGSQAACNSSQSTPVRADVATDRSDQSGASCSGDHTQDRPHSGSRRKRDAPGSSVSPEKHRGTGSPASKDRGSSVQSPPRKVPCWKGRPPHPVTPAEPSHDPNSLPPPHDTEQDMQDDCGPCQAPQSRAGGGKRLRHLPHRQKYAKLHRLTQMLDTGQLASVFQELECDIDPDFLPANPELLFELHRCQYHALLEAGNTDQALKLMRSQLTPLSQSHPHLQPKVKASMACLLPDSGKETLPRDCFSSAAGLLQSALRAKLGLPQPRLLELMQRCKDCFEGLLKIDQLRAGSTPATLPPDPSCLTTGRMSSGGRASRNAVPAADVVMADAAGNISSEHDSEGAHSDDAMSEPEEVELTEQTIITTMEFTGLPRHQVIDLLLHNEGDPTAVMAQLFP